MIQMLVEISEYSYIYSRRYRETRPNMQRLLIAHVPRGLELISHRLLCENRITGQTAHAAGTVANRSKLDGRDTALITADGAGIAAVVGLGKLSRRSKVKGCECARLAEEVTIKMD